jgi:acetyl-CoA carboxylase, biotin carboxylase subunit
MFHRILVANRGEAAARVVRSCRRLGVQTVAVVSEADAELAWLAEADRVVCIGGSHPRDSYLLEDVLLEVARRERCSAIHPGWGFLAENARFAARCEAIGQAFVGPRPHVLARMGNKVAARKAAAAAGLQVLPGTGRPLRDLDDAQRSFEALTDPESGSCNAFFSGVLLKAKAGGGGKGLRVVRSAAELPAAWAEARAQALAAFGDGDLFMESRLPGARHVEFQVLGDRFGNVVVLGSRDCSVQRSFQKLVEESPGLDSASPDVMALEKRLSRWLSAEGYHGAGTVEMLRDPGGGLHFLECNARLQVEHSVTEVLWGLDLVEMQLRVAAGEVRPWGEPVPVPGHSIECRINAEDPENDFSPCPGRINRLDLPRMADVRIDTHLRPETWGQGDRIPAHYDSLLCKVIVRASDRDRAIDLGLLALHAVRVEGVRTNLDYLKSILMNPEFRDGRHDTGFVGRYPPRSPGARSVRGA